MLYAIAYCIAGVAVYFATRGLYRAKGFSPDAHRKSWIFVSSTFEGWFLAIFWPAFAIVSLVWLSFELYDRKLKKEEALARQKEAAERKPGDALSLLQKIDRLQAAAERLKKAPNPAPESTGSERGTS